MAPAVASGFRSACANAIALTHGRQIDSKKMDRFGRARDASYFDTRTITLLNRIANKRRALQHHVDNARSRDGGTTTAPSSDARLLVRATGGWGTGDAGVGRGTSLGRGRLRKAGVDGRDSAGGEGGGQALDVRPVTPLALLGSAASSSDLLPHAGVRVLCGLGR